MGEIEQRAKRIVAAKTTEFIVDKLTGDERERLKEAKRRERDAQVKALARAAASESSPSRRDTAGTQPSVIDEMMDDEDCPVCTKILESVRDMNEPKRTRGVAAYGEFRQAIEQSEEAAVEVLEDNAVLNDALQNVRAGEL